MFEFRNPIHLEFPAEAETILNQIRYVLRTLVEEHIHAVAGGGILRDLYLDRPYKDIDIFANANDASDEKLLGLLAELGFKCKMVVSNEATEYLSFTDVASVIEATHSSLPVPVQVIRVASNNQSGERLIERLDLGPCQIGMDCLGHYWHTVQFWEDVSERTFTVTRTEGRDIERSTKRFERLSQKYVGWKLVIP
jgi:hypothetical protein